MFSNFDKIFDVLNTLFMKKNIRWIYVLSLNIFPSLYEVFLNLKFDIKFFTLFMIQNFIWIYLFH